MEILREPFGLDSCEKELHLLGAHYGQYYFDHAPFNNAVLDSDCYLIVGRRGSGKTSLANYFQFQTRYKNSKNYYIESPLNFIAELDELLNISSMDNEIIINAIVKYWEYFIWNYLFVKYKSYDEKIKLAANLITNKKGFRTILQRILKGLSKKYIGYDSQDVFDLINDKLNNSSVISDAKETLLNIANTNPIFISIDSPEHYDINNHKTMLSLAALIQFATYFNINYRRNKLFLKVFVPDEIYPELKESVITNPGKYLKNPVLLHWRPKDLFRLICWRYFKYLETMDLAPCRESEIEWDDFKKVKDKFWKLFFGISVNNRLNLKEDTFPYIMRHTQMKPRELINICNSVARLSKANGNFPEIGSQSLNEGMHKECKELASQVINSYNNLYPNISNIIEALIGLPNVFEGKLLDKVASKTASAWKNGNYNLVNFRKLVAQLGIVGRQRKRNGNIIEADFEYFQDDRLWLDPHDICVIHPMFYQKLRTSFQETCITYPFPDHPAYIEAIY